MMKLHLFFGFLLLHLWPWAGAASQTTPAVTTPTSSSASSTVSAQSSVSTNSSQDAVLNIRSLMEAGRLGEASRELSRQLQKPDPEPGLQLLQCVLLANQNQNNKAIVCLSDLIKVRPDMLEAYNNLGVLHANLGQHEEAKRWLTLAMQRVPSLWTVYQNLQTLQIDLSRKSYARALQAELPLKDTPPRLTMLASTALTNPIKVAQAVSQPTPKPTALPTPGPEPVNKEAVKTDADKTQTAKAGEVKAKVVDDATRQQLQAAVESWAQAWSAQNMTAYFAAYASDFTPSQSKTRATWEAERTSRIIERQFVKVSVSNFSFEQQGNKTAVRFNQVYESDNIRSTNRKQLDLNRVDGNWKIVRETLIAQ